MSFTRYVALGDSFTEGVGDPDDTRPNGLRGWADRVAEVLAAGADDFGYANLAIRGRKLVAILDEQVDPAIALEPDLITIHAGGNDILRPRVDLDHLAGRYDEAVGKLTATGAQVVMWTGLDLVESSLYGRLRGRVATFNELVREISDKHGSLLLDLWRLREFRDWRLWGTDRLHLGPAGHQLMAIRVLDLLKVPHRLEPLPLPPVNALSRREELRADLEWARTFAAPWLHRRLTGRSSGDGVHAKRPTLERI